MADTDSVEYTHIVGVIKKNASAVLEGNLPLVRQAEGECEPPAVIRPEKKWIAWREKWSDLRNQIIFHLKKENQWKWWTAIQRRLTDYSSFHKKGGACSRQSIRMSRILEGEGESLDVII